MTPSGIRVADCPAGHANILPAEPVPVSRVYAGDMLHRQTSDSPRWRPRESLARRSAWGTVSACRDRRAPQNDKAFALLRDIKELGAEYLDRDSVSLFHQAGEHCADGLTPVVRQKTTDVLHHDDIRLAFPDGTRELEEQRSARIPEAFRFSGIAERLAGDAALKED